MHELSKREKKIARACIDKGLDAEFREALEKFEAIIQNWRNGKFPTNREAYRALYKAVGKKDYAISRRYNELTGSRWLVTVACIFADGYITEDDFREFSDETKSIIKKMSTTLE